MLGRRASIPFSSFVTYNGRECPEVASDCTTPAFRSGIQNDADRAHRKIPPFAPSRGEWIPGTLLACAMS